MARKGKGEVARGNGKDGRAALVTAGLILAALAIISASSVLLPFFGGFGRPAFVMVARFGAPQPELGEFFDFRLGLSLLNVLLLVYLLFIHVRDYLRLKSSFTLGLVAFLFSFLMYAVSSLPLVHMFMGPFGFASIFSFVPMLFSAIGLLIFAKLSNE